MLTCHCCLTFSRFLEYIFLPAKSVDDQSVCRCNNKMLFDLDTPYQSHNFDHTYLYPETSLSKGCRTEVKITVDFESPLTKSLLSFGAKKSLNLYKEKTSQKALVPTYNISLFAMYMIYY